jgi:serine/threonine protein kinase
MSGDLRAALETALAGRYAIERELGRGGMATVFLARDLRHDRPVALKVLHPQLAAALGGERFQREIRLAARLQHPHILTVHDSGEIPAPNGPPLLWFTMPFVDGETLRARLLREKQLPLEEALSIAREAADALDYAHEHGIVHRDIKPENILLAGRHALVADFGIARALAGAEQGLTETGMTLGTPAYMSPEQASGERAIDGRTDIYSLGCVLYEMLAGQPPFAGATAQALIAQRFTETPPLVRRARSSVPPEIEAAIARALARVPADRFATAGEFAETLTDGQGGRWAGGQADRASWSRRSPHQSRIHPPAGPPVRLSASQPGSRSSSVFWSRRAWACWSGSGVTEGAKWARPGPSASP